MHLIWKEQQGAEELYVKSSEEYGSQVFTVKAKVAQLYVKQHPTITEPSKSIRNTCALPIKKAKKRLTNQPNSAD